MTRITFAILLACTLMSAVMVSPAAAQNETAARALYRQADLAYAEGRYELALGLFEQAYEASPRPLILVSIANTLERLNRIADAIERLQLFLPEAPEDMRGVIERRIQALETREAQRMAEEERRRLVERLEQEQAAERLRAEEEARLAAVFAQQDAEQEEESSSNTPRGAIALLSAGVAGAVVATWMGIAARSESDDASSECRRAEGGAGLLCPASVRGSVGRAEDLALGADIAWGVTAALFAAGVLWLTLDLTRDGSEADVSVSFGPMGAQLRAHY